MWRVSGMNTIPCTVERRGPFKSPMKNKTRKQSHKGKEDPVSITTSYIARGLRTQSFSDTCHRAAWNRPAEERTNDYELWTIWHIGRHTSARVHCAVLQTRSLNTAVNKQKTDLSTRLNVQHYKLDLGWNVRSRYTWNWDNQMNIKIKIWRKLWI